MLITNEKLQTIKDNVSKVYRSGQMDVIKNANSLKGFESNKAMLLDDVSPVTHEMGVKVRGKNLFDKNNFNHLLAYIDNAGVIVHSNADNMYRLPCKPNTTYTVSRIANSVTIMVGYYASFPALGSTSIDNVRHTSSANATSYTFTTVSGTNYIALRLSKDNKEAVENSVQLELGTTKTAYTPYVPDLTTVKVTRRGKNLFSGLTKGIGIHSTNGSEITNSNYAASDYIPVDFNANTNYYISGLPTTISNFVAAYNANKEFLGRTGGSVNSNYKMASAASFQSGTPQGTGDISYLRVCCYKTSANTGTINDIDGCNIQLEVGSVATDYEPYKGAEYTPNSDGTVEGITSLYPTTVLLTDTDGVIIDCDYYKDIDKAFNELTTSVALSGGE